MIYDWTSEISEDDLMDEWMKRLRGADTGFQVGFGVGGPLERLKAE